MSDRWRYTFASEMLSFYRWAFSETRAGRIIRIDWASEPLDTVGWRAHFMRALDRRINLKAGPPPAWRKLDPLYQTELMRDCQRIRDHATRRLIVRQIMTPELRRRFGHIITTGDD